MVLYVEDDKKVKIHGNDGVYLRIHFVHAISISNIVEQSSLIFVHQQYQYVKCSEVSGILETSQSVGKLWSSSQI